LATRGAGRRERDQHGDPTVSTVHLAAEYDHTLIEIPPGRPQIRFHEGSEQLVPRGDVLRCHIEDDEAGQDDQELSLHLLRTHAGWGMRISFVPEDRVADQPEIEVREPGEDER
jgi:hypothetical protein